MLQIQHLTKAYGDKKAVDDLCLHIAPGEIYGFIGHNGAGKTTTLKPLQAFRPSTRARFSSAVCPFRRIPSAASGRWPIFPIIPTCMNS